MKLATDQSYNKIKIKNLDNGFFKSNVKVCYWLIAKKGKVRETHSHKRKTFNKFTNSLSEFANFEPTSLIYVDKTII